MVENTAGQDLGIRTGSYHADAKAQVYKDALLAERLRQGEDAAFEELLNTYQDSVYNLVFRLVNHQSDAQDITQDVFLKVFRNLGRFEGKSTLKTWIYRIAINESYNHRRWFSRHRKGEVSLIADEECNQSWNDLLPDPCRSPFQLALDSETRQLIEDALGQINPLFRAAVVLRDLEELSYEEIAEVLEVNLGTVKSRILRGRDALRRELEQKVSPAEAFAWSAQTAPGQ
ncbi:MAG: RNA polymerase sigma factor RpoE [Bryobacter sp.]